MTSLAGHLRRLASHSLVYGAADVFTNVVNLLLTPLYTVYLGPRDYGYIGLLSLFSAVGKIVFRLGLDAAFFRVYYDVSGEDRKRLGGTVALFSAATATLLFAGVVAGARPLAHLLLQDETRSAWVILAAADIFLGSFAFVPLNLLRIQERPRLFSTFAAGRHALNTVLKVVLVMRGLGVTGVLWSDALATAAFSLALLPILWRNASFRFSTALLREVLGFGLPKVPHGLMVQVQNLADRRILAAFAPTAEVGLYHVAYTFGTGVKFALSAFEPAWQPFVYSQIGKPDAPVTLARVITYAWAGFLTLGLSVAVFGRELLMALTYKNPAFWAAAPVVPVVVLAYLLHGVFLLTSIGIGIEKKARYYPIVTAAAAATNVGMNLLLIPRFGMMGAAWATVLSYVVMASLGYSFSQRLYPLPLEGGRLLRLTAAAALAHALSLLAPSPLASALFVKAAALLVFPALVLATGFLAPRERDALRKLDAFRGPRDKGAD